MAEIPPLYDKKVECLMCDAAFDTKRLRSRAVRLVKSWNDFYKEYKNPELNPILYEVNVCKRCGFAFTDLFNPVKDVECKEIFADKVTAKWEPQDFNSTRTHEQAVNTYKLGILSAKITEQPPVIIAGLCLKLTWIFRYLNAAGEEERFKQFAVRYYGESLLKGDFQDKGMTEISVLFLLGELNRQLNQLDESGKYFSEIIQHDKRHQEPQLLEKAREQWYETRQKMKNTT